MIVYANREELVKIIKEEMSAWEALGPNPNAFEFDPKTVDPKQLLELGYYDGVESWIAGARLNKLSEYLKQIENLPQAANLK